MKSFTLTGEYPVRQIVEFCFSHEFQFEVKTKKTNVLVAFSKGFWEILFEETGDHIEFGDGPNVVTCENPLLLGFLTAKMESAESLREAKKETWNFYTACRDVPAKYLTDLILLVGEELQGVHVVLPGRNGYISDGKIVTQRKDW